MKKIIVVSCLLTGLSLLAGCASLKAFLSGGTTKLTSNSLAAARALRAMGITISGTREGNNWTITPTKISGKILSIVLPIDGTEDDGIVPFGDGRPDIAPAQSRLYDFDLSQVTTLYQEVVGFKPGYAGGRASQILLIFGYFDVEFQQGTADKKIRFCYGDSHVYRRGDKLLYNANGATTNAYYWYGTSAEAFVVETGSRPAHPSANAYVRDYSDPVRPEMHYYLLGAQLRNNTDYDGTVRDYISLNRNIIEDKELSFTVDFDVRNAVVFTDVSSEAEFNALSDADLVRRFDMKQNVSDWRDSGLYSSISFEVISRY